jgi:sugar lactone lactonase YvrE
LGILAAALCASPARAQFVSTVVSTNLTQPAGVATDTANNVYITDAGNFRIAKYVPSSGTLSTLAGSGAFGANVGTGTAASFSSPQGIVAARGGLIVADEGSQLIRYVSFGGTVSNLAGQAYVVGNANGPAATASFGYPVGIAVDSVGNLYVADSQNRAIREIDTNNMVSTVPTGGFAFNLPSAVAVDNNGNIWVADSGNDVICMISNGTVTVVAGTSGKAGTNDSTTATSALFSSPSGLLWVSANNSLLIDDTGNNTVRSLFATNVNGSASYAVQTITGIPGVSGLVNGTPAIAEFHNPSGLCVDAEDSGFYIADTGNNALRVFQPSAPQPPVSAPVLGYVIFVPGPSGTPVSQFDASSAAVFNNPAIIAIKSETDAETYITYGPTPSNPLSNNIPLPGNGQGTSPSIYAGDGLPFSSIGPSIVSPQPDITIYAISTAPGRQPSPVVSARYQFITANPNLSGNDAAEIKLTDLTVNAEMFYTLDGSTPTNDGSNGIGPIGSGDTIAINLVSNLTLNVRAFAPNFTPSGVASEQLTISNDVGDQMTFGFASGEASSRFIGAAGQRFLAPVTLTMISGGTTYSMQFAASVTNGTGPALTSFNSRFDSMLKYGPPPLLASINPGIVINAGTNFVVSGGVLTNLSENLLEMAWIEAYPDQVLYNTQQQDLTAYSQAHDNIFLETGGAVIVGAYSFVIPTNAGLGSTYTIQLLRPSATTYNPPLTAPLGVFMQAPTNGSLTNGAINSIKNVTVGSVPYLVGDGYPFRWFNAGDFGDGNLLNDDVIETFQSAVYKVNTPPAGCDYFNALDSSNGTTNNIYNGNDTTINSITDGDGILAVDDVYVTLRRSLDPSLTWYDRYWSNGIRYSVAVPNVITLKAGSAPASSPAPLKTALNGPRFVTVAADQIQAGGNLTVHVPIRVLAADTLPVRVALLNVEIDPLDGSPPITSLISFSAATNLGSPYASDSLSPNNYAAAWLNSTVPGVSGKSLIGTLTVTLPSNVTANSAYLVHFDHFSASPNGLALFHATVQDGLITVGNRTGSSWGDGIPDSWRLLYFGTVSNILSAANADPDGDGASNWQEYIAGTNPLDATSVFAFAPSASPAGNSFTLEWSSVVNKNYSVQSSSSLGGVWTTIATNLIGTGQPLQWTDTNGSTGARFYRAQVQ